MVNSHGRFAWYELMTTDMEAAKAFYTKVMDWRALEASLSGGAYTLFTAGKALVSGLMDLPEDTRNMGGKPSWVGYVGVNDVDATADRIKRLGGAVHVPPTDVPNISRFSIFADPQSARLGLLNWLKPRQEQPPLGAPGRVGWHELFAADCEKALAFYGELFGWQKGDAEIGEMGTYQLFSAAGGQTIGGMLTKPSMMPAPFWLYYFNTGDLEAATQRVEASGGQILDGPFELPGGNCIIHCTDPQGAIFALQAKRDHKAIGYFEDARGRRWSW